MQAPLKVGPWPRFAARFIDGLVLIIPTAIVNGIVGVDTFASTFDTEDAGKIFIAGVLSAVITVAYFAFMESNNGQTVGKMALSMKVMGPDGQNPTVEQAFKRNAFYLLQIFPVIGGLAALVVVIVIAVGISNDPRGQSAHDRFAGGTLVYKV